MYKNHKVFSKYYHNSLWYFIQCTFFPNRLFYSLEKTWKYNTHNPSNNNAYTRIKRPLYEILPTITPHKQWLLFLHGCLQSPCKSIRILPNFFIHLFLNHSIETRRTILIQHLICLQHSRRIKIIEIRVQLLIRYRYNWRKEINTNNPRK